MKITSNVFTLNPGFTVEGVGNVTGCRVKLLTKNDRDTVGDAAQQKVTERIKDAQLAAKAQGVGELDPMVRYMISESTREQALVVSSIDAFITESGTEVTDRGKVASYFGLLTEPDEEAIKAEREELTEKFRRPKSRPHQCGQCGAEVICERTSA